jgi:hypothetical protein
MTLFEREHGCAMGKTLEVGALRTQFGALTEHASDDINRWWFDDWD